VREQFLIENISAVRENPSLDRTEVVHADPEDMNPAEFVTSLNVLWPEVILPVLSADYFKNT
jgi:hypothetical protein